VAPRKKNALRGRCTVWFADESGATLTPLVGKTWGPRGRTPLLPHNFGRWEKVSMISAVGTTRRLYFRFKLREAMKAVDVARFLRHFLRHVPGRIVLFWDGATQHKGTAIRRVLDDHPRLRIEPLPPYGFDYNPDEGVWCALKWGRLRNHAPRTTEDLVDTLRRELRGIQRRPDAIAGFFRRTKLPRGDVESLFNQARNL